MNALPFALKHWLGRAEFASHLVLGALVAEAVAVGVGPGEAVAAGVPVVGAAVPAAVQDGSGPGVGHCIAERRDCCSFPSGTKEARAGMTRILVLLLQYAY